MAKGERPAPRRFRLGESRSNEPSVSVINSDTPDDISPSDLSPEEEKTLNAPLNEQAPRRIKRAKRIAKAPQPKTESQKAASSKIVAEQLALITGAACGMFAFATKHDFWYLDDRESLEWGKALSSQIPKMTPKQIEFLEERVPQINLMLVAAQIFGPRLMMEFEVRRGDFSRWQTLQHTQNANGMKNVPTPNDRPTTETPPPQDMSNVPHFEIPGLTV